MMVAEGLDSDAENPICGAPSLGNTSLSGNVLQAEKFNQNYDERN
jgi:hypothetical protein